MKKELEQLRERMSDNDIDVYFVPSGDEHNSEFVHDRFRCVEFLTGFTGEAAELVVTKDGAYLWTDGRFFLQAEDELAGTGVQLMRSGTSEVPTTAEFLVDLAAETPYTLGFDGKVVNNRAACDFRGQLDPYGVKLRFDKDLAGEIWSGRPEIEPSELFALPASSTGETFPEKLARVRSEMQNEKADYLLISDLTETAWLFNLRGSDIDYTPVFFSYTLVSEEEVSLFLMDRVLPDSLAEALTAAGVHIEHYTSIDKRIAALPPDKTLWLDSATAGFSLCQKIPSGMKIVDLATPVYMMKAVKNPVEIKSTCRAHIRDGLAMIRFICWLKENVERGELTELSAAKYLKKCRLEQEGCFDLSFETISGYGPNAAIVHYAPTPETNAVIRPEGFLLVDSGGQYLEGTTDITRTIAVGPLTEEMIRDYTLVLKSHIEMARVCVLDPMSGPIVDTVARKPLQDAGLDFRHGLSHGVGHILAVHEGPPVLKTDCPFPMKPGMILTDEPGVYIDHQFGIRIENELLCCANEDGDLCFEPITLCPYERRAIDKSLLSENEIRWIDMYHRNVRDTLLPLVEEQHLAEFLIAETEPL